MRTIKEDLEQPQEDSSVELIKTGRYNTVVKQRLIQSNMKTARKMLYN